jgi:hypothetical protein
MTELGLRLPTLSPAKAASRRDAQFATKKFQDRSGRILLKKSDFGSITIVEAAETLRVFWLGLGLQGSSPADEVPRLATRSSNVGSGGRSDETIFRRAADSGVFQAHAG